MKVTFIGAGNLATRLALEMQKAGITIHQIYSRTLQSGEILALKLGCPYTDSIEQILPDADLYVFSLKDAVLDKIISQMVPNGGLWVHTAGSIPMSVFEGYASRYGVLYPLQTFSKEREVVFSRIPFFIEANNEEDVVFLASVAALLTSQVKVLPSAKRKMLHLAAVFACNFTNHMYALAARIVEEQDLPFDYLLPLIDETAAKVHFMLPSQAQTGPAIRYDQNVIQKHQEMLSEEDMQMLYEQISKSIYKEASRK
ncbi:Rossmann-like and DUF2520 domain-containing protein [Parabacteroides pacaensis]|uniref:Rossmann-like and DUF2520 domain-containing protein n=1 Tax=Parabacteroides pacaensis TaxID=2086575 RepID=UPI000D0FBEA2|nr:Rossmann-like and DUF2520 domain-containing protein [Parabacteroides pacaensis]